MSNFAPHIAQARDGSSSHPVIPVHSRQTGALETKCTALLATTDTRGEPVNRVNGLSLRHTVGASELLYGHGACMQTIRVVK